MSAGVVRHGDTTIAVTGVTGNLGGQVACLLASAGIPLRLLARNPNNAPALPNCETVACSYSDPGEVAAALREIDTVLMISATETPNRIDDHCTFIDAATAAGVSHIVYTSFAGAAPDAEFTLARDHFATEAILHAAGPNWTVLRNNLYQDFLLTLPGPDGVIRAPAGEGRVAAVARVDIAAAAAAVLAHPTEHLDRTYELTGPQAFTFDEIASQLTVALGKPIRYYDETVEEAYESRRSWAAEQWQYDAWVSTYTAIAGGEMAHVSEDLSLLIGRRTSLFRVASRAARTIDS
jgi:uncharacterized protein YbjT (DUF2867 family)